MYLQEISSQVCTCMVASAAHYFRNTDKQIHPACGDLAGNNLEAAMCPPRDRGATTAWRMPVASCDTCTAAELPTAANGV